MCSSDLLPALLRSADHHQLTVLGIQPGWSGALAQACADEPTLRVGAAQLLVAEGGCVTVLRLDDGVLADVQQHWLAQPRADALQALLPHGTQAVVLGHGLMGPVPTGWTALGDVAGPAQPARWQQPVSAPNFLPLPVAPLRRLGWALAAAGACVLALAGADAWQARAALVEQQSAQPSTELGVRLRGSAADQAARARLAHPWPAVVAAAEATVPAGGHWLALEHQAGQRELRLSGVAASLPAAWAAAEKVGRSPGIADAMVARSTVVRVGLNAGPVSAAAADAGDVEFDIVARLAP